MDLLERLGYSTVGGIGGFAIGWFISGLARATWHRDQINMINDGHIDRLHMYGQMFLELVSLENFKPALYSGLICAVGGYGLSYLNTDLDNDFNDVLNNFQKSPSFQNSNASAQDFITNLSNVLNIFVYRT